MNKQIEEMAKVLCNNCAGKESPCRVAKSGAMCKSIQREAEALYTAGYRKQSEGEWILHKPRRENRNATYKCSVCGKLCSSYYNDVGEWKCCPHCGAKMKGGAE